jgi:hypothetical protein
MWRSNWALPGGMPSRTLVGSKSCAPAASARPSWRNGYSTGLGKAEPRPTSAGSTGASRIENTRSSTSGRTEAMEGCETWRGCGGAGRAASVTK